MHFPSTLLDHLRTTVHGFADEELRDQLSLTLMLWACADGGRPHKLWPGMFSFSNREIRDFWGEDARMRRVVAHRYFTVHQGSNLTEATNAYAPSIEMATALVRSIRSHATDEWLDARERSWVPSGNAVASMAAPAKDGKGNRQTKWKGAEPAKFVPINVIALRSYREDLVAAWKDRRLVERAAEWVQRQIRSIDGAIKYAQNTRCAGCFPVKYREGSTGRISAQGHSLQSMPGMVRSAALAGMWDYDISTCQWTVLSQLASRLGIDSPLTNAYIANKHALRVTVADGAGIPLDDAKQCITALLFGAVVQRSEKAMRFQPGDLVKAVGMPAAVRLGREPDFMALYTEVGRVGKAIVKAWPRKNGRLFNDLSIKYESGSELAHLLQGAEAAALRAVVRQQQGNILLCLHDGWIAQQRLDPGALAAQIQAETGYNFRVEEAQLEVPGRDQIKRKLDEFEEFSEGELHFECPFAVAQGGQGLREVPGGTGKAPPRSAALDEASLWTAHPHPSEPVLARLAFVSPRPAWNLPPGSTADFVDRKRKDAAALSGRRPRRRSGSTD